GADMLCKEQGCSETRAASPMCVRNADQPEAAPSGTESAEFSRCATGTNTIATPTGTATSPTRFNDAPKRDAWWVGCRRRLPLIRNVPRPNEKLSTQGESTVLTQNHALTRDEQLSRLALHSQRIRRNIIEMVAAANSGHP